MDTELFELCKEVRRRTTWIDTYQTIAQDPGDPPYRRVVNTQEFKKSEGLNYGFDIPLYTSDYLLEKLPRKFKKQGSNYWLEVSPMDLATWGACYADDEDGMEYFNYSDTPLKALLKLVVALHEAGELK